VTTSNKLLNDITGQKYKDNIHIDESLADAVIT
jgi:hypothetical protein